MYLVLKPVHSMNGKRSCYYEAIWSDDARIVSEYCKEEGVRVYKLDALQHVTGINVTTEDIIA
jgi:hypothetical protein